MRFSSSDDDSLLARDVGPASPSGGSVSVSFARRAEEVLPILSEPGIFRATSQDGEDASALAGIDAVLRLPRCRFVVARDGGREVGLFFFVGYGEGQWELHTAFLPGHRGAIVLAAFATAIELMRKTCHIEEVVTRVPAFNKPAGRLASAAGFRRSHVAPREFRKGGELHDVAVYVYEVPGGQACL